MHLLFAQPGDATNSSGAVDLGQSPGDIVFLSAADSELACLATAQDHLIAASTDKHTLPPPTLRLANFLWLSHPLSVDLYVDRIILCAKLVVVRILGGERYWHYGVEQIAAACAYKGISLAFLPGDDQADVELLHRSTLPQEKIRELWSYLIHGGLYNAKQFLNFCSFLMKYSTVSPRSPFPLPRSAFYWPNNADHISYYDITNRWRLDSPVVPILFYRALLQSGDLEAIDALIDALIKKGLNPLPIALMSLKEIETTLFLSEAFQNAPPDLILNATNFAVAHPGVEHGDSPFPHADCPVLQIVFSSNSEEKWRISANGLEARDLAMAVALPELDGRILSRAIAFKAEAKWHAPTQCRLNGYRPSPDRIDFVVTLASAWCALRRTPASQRRIAILLANYPNRDGRLANGVGLDTPAGVFKTFTAMIEAGYNLGERIPCDSTELMAHLVSGATNDLKSLDQRVIEITFPVTIYHCWFKTLPPDAQKVILNRWGLPEDDPGTRNDAFCLSLHQFGNIVIGIQPARGYHIDPTRSYHDPSLPPPHGYLACYAWLRTIFKAHAIIHFGKHGNLEWLPGKALSLSNSCFPEIALGAIPHIYPFIVNDPGEGAQAKRRAAAVIIDHLTPPLTRAGNYGDLQTLESLVDEYYQASGLDSRRLPLLRERIFDIATSLGLDRDCGVSCNDDTDAALTRIDNYLCELKELQIRDGLHVFGCSPTGDQLNELLVSLTRIPRGRGENGDASLLRALAADLSLDFDPLTFPDYQSDESNPQERTPPHLWRIQVESLENTAYDLISGKKSCPKTWMRTTKVLHMVETILRPKLVQCGPAEQTALLRALDGKFVAPGPSGAPTRGRPDVLPTGRNFYAVDTRAVPTPTAWILGWKSASLLIERHLQDHGDYPRTIAMSAWGTANMRTGGDDIAQALALMGVRPQWDSAGSRVSGFEILPLSILDRPRVDVTLRVSGFFRDAFPAQIALVDEAARAVAKLDELESENPLAARYRSDIETLLTTGVSLQDAERQAGFRVFGSKPGAYGAGLQALIDERGWSNANDLANAYLIWGGYAYGADSQGTEALEVFKTRLRTVDAIIQNQDNREHDLLDSDDYYQFEGGLAAAARFLSGCAPTIYHNDHSRPEQPRIRTLEEEIARIVRGRVTNPKWISGVMRHGYKGAFEMAATVDYMFAFAATTNAVKHHHFDAVYDAFISDDVIRSFIAEANPAALREMATRFQEAIDRGLWRPRSNSAPDILKTLK
ncbi:Aerobic cobaltochelatase subunit CobN [Azospirillaceae bacterium]